MGGRGGRYDSIVRECVSTVPSAGGEKLLFLEWGEECETGFGGAAARDARHSQGEQDAFAGIRFVLFSLRMSVSVRRLDC
jgi:hypothetical protein